MRISDWSSDVCSSDLVRALRRDQRLLLRRVRQCQHVLRAGDVFRRAVRERQFGGVAGAALPPIALAARLHRLERGQVAGRNGIAPREGRARSEEHTSELQSLMRISYAVLCLKKKTQQKIRHSYNKNTT